MIHAVQPEPRRLPPQVPVRRPHARMPHRPPTCSQRVRNHIVALHPAHQPSPVLGRWLLGGRRLVHERQRVCHLTTGKVVAPFVVAAVTLIHVAQKHCRMFCIISQPHRQIAIIIITKPWSCPCPWGPGTPCHTPVSHASSYFMHMHTSCAS